MPMADHDRGGSQWAREVRRHHEGTLLTGERAVRVRFIIDGSRGEVVVPVEGWVLDTPDASLFLPEERRDALQLLIEFGDEEPGGAARDRWCAYHGEARERHWGAARITGLRREDEVCEEAGIAPTNALRGAEARLLKLLNSQRSVLPRVCERLAGVNVPDACAVGIDPYGIDVRARFGIVRAEFPAEQCDPARGIECPDRAAEVVTAILRGAGGGEP
jgi:hypothetical protein